MRHGLSGEAEMREDAALMAHLSAPERPVGAYLVRPARRGSWRSRCRALVPAGFLACRWSARPGTGRWFHPR